MSPLWASITRLKLTTNMRVQQLQLEGQDAGEQQAFADLLLRVGGVGGDFEIPAAMRAATQEPGDLIRTVFGDLGGDSAARSKEQLTARALLTPCNDNVDALNDQVLANFPGERGVRLCQWGGAALPALN